jgi:hypothetical protein
MLRVFRILAVTFDRVTLRPRDQRLDGGAVLNRLCERLARRLLGLPPRVGGPEPIECLTGAVRCAAPVAPILFLATC